MNGHASGSADALARDVVVLVPGFLGFARFGNFYYFADRVSALLRGALEARLGRPVPVVPCTMLPTHALAARQRHVLSFLSDLQGKIPAVERFHLVGHSTGGVDAQLLTCAPKISEADWSPEENVIRRKIRSVVTISAPHYGTTLAETPLARAFDAGYPFVTAIPSAARLGWDFLRVLPNEIAAWPALAPGWIPEKTKFLLQILRQRKLAGDLRPCAMETLRGKLEPDLPVALTCVVTAAEPRTDADRPSEPLFRDLYDLTASETPRLSARVTKTIDMLERYLHSDVLIRSPIARPPTHIESTLNDGIVNTARQVVNPGRPKELAAIVIADHADVLGHYDRRDALLPGRVLNAGLFHSGAGFGDDEFFALYRRIADRIARAASATSAESAAGNAKEAPPRQMGGKPSLKAVTGSRRR